METRKPIPFLDGKYEASNLWNIRESDKLLKQYKRKDGYMRVNFYKLKSYPDMKVHRLVASAFLWLDLSLWRKQCALHKNDIRDDNRLENIYVWTYKDNTIDRSIRNRWFKCKWSNNPSSILKEKQVISIKKLINKWILKHGQIWDLFWISRDAIQKTSSWKNWKHIIV